MITKIKFWIQKQIDNTWIDWAEKDSEEICMARIDELKEQIPERKFRIIKRTITDEITWPV